MSEIINTYLLEDSDTLIPMNQDEFYREQIEVFKKINKKFLREQGSRPAS
jgi:hypothetical protein